MTAVALRNKLHTFIDSVEQKKLKAIYTLLESEIEDSSLLSESQKHELDKRMAEYQNGKGENFSWQSAVKKIKSSK
jgi:Putative addiction module component